MAFTTVFFFVTLLAATPVQEPELMQGRKLFIVGRGDLTGSGRQRLESVRNQYLRAKDPKQLAVIESDAHAQFLFESDHGRETMETILRFLKACQVSAKPDPSNSSTGPRTCHAEVSP